MIKVYRDRLIKVFNNKGPLSFEENAVVYGHDKSFVTMSDVYLLPSKDSEPGEPPFIYQEACNSDYGGVIEITDPYNQISSKTLAEETVKSLEGVVIDISQFPEEKTTNLWSPDLHKRFGDLEKETHYILCGFENLPEDKLSKLFKFPYFEVGLEHYQENRGIWEGIPHNHKILFLITGSAEIALF